MAVIIPLIITVETLQIPIITSQITYTEVKNGLFRTLMKRSTRVVGTQVDNGMDLQSKLWARNL